MIESNMEQKNLHPSLFDRKIIHFDMDAFYASVEIRDRPELKGQPVVVGGSPQSRAVVCTASYEARKFGIRSAMACSKAARLCPQAVFLPPDFTKYVAVSLQIRAIFSRYTDLIEPLSLDEAYLDVTNNKFGWYAVKIAKAIQQDILKELHLSGSAGVAPNKLLAKIASDLRKPMGLSLILPENVQDFMRLLPLRKIHGVGPATESFLKGKGFQKCEDLWPLERASLIEKIGSNLGDWLYDACRGIDLRPVRIERIRKSLGQEQTFSTDIIEIPVLRKEISSLCREVASHLKGKNLRGKTITLKVKYHDFKQITRSATINKETSDAEEIARISLELLTKTEAGRQRIRLLGVSVSNLLQT